MALSSCVSTHQTLKSAPPLTSLPPLQLSHRATLLPNPLASHNRELVNHKHPVCRCNRPGSSHCAAAPILDRYTITIDDHGLQLPPAKHQLCRLMSRSHAQVQLVSPPDLISTAPWQRYGRARRTDLEAQRPAEKAFPFFAGGATTIALGISALITCLARFLAPFLLLRMCE